MQKLISHYPKNGAYTQLFASHSPSITEKHNGSWGKYSLLSPYYTPASFSEQYANFKLQFADDTALVYSFTVWKD